jgi:hypothetical protein
MGQGVDGVELIDVSPVSGRRFRQRRGIGWLSVACDCMSAMASAPADNVATTAVAMPRRRGKSKPPNFSYQGPVSVIRMELDATDEQVRRRVERQWVAVFQLRRALQRDAAARSRVYWAGNRERARDARALRERLGLTRKGMEAAAKAHIEASGWMRDHLTKAVGLHVADEVWQTIDRHLFADASGRRHGPPRVGSWWDFTRIPGRARSHTKAAAPVWETWRLVGTLDAHLSTYRHPQLPACVTTATAAAGQPPGSPILAQPARLPVPVKPVAGSWWEHAGALAVVFIGLPGGDLVLPVRLAQGAGQWARLPHFLADRSSWHKIDLVWVRDRRTPGGWRYCAHLLVHQPGYQSPATKARRAQIPGERRAGIDANVSNLSLASFPDQRPDELIVEQITLTGELQRAAQRAAWRARARQKAMERSRRSTNPDQYGLSVRQHVRAARRVGSGLSAKRVTNPGGARHGRADGTPLRAYRHDTLSHSYHKTRADHATHAAARSRAKHARARELAGPIVTAHGNTITVEDTNIGTWARLWGKRIQLFSPGILVAALAAECAATGGRVQRAGTRSTALSQHCRCGARVPKTVAQRTHDCTHCGLNLDRDIASAALAACIEFADREDPRTARVDHRLAHALRAGLASQQEARTPSTGTSHRRHHAAVRPGPATTTRWPLLSNATTTGPPPNRPAPPLDVAGPAERGAAQTDSVEA